MKSYHQMKITRIMRRVRLVQVNVMCVHTFIIMTLYLPILEVIPKENAISEDKGTEQLKVHDIHTCSV